MAFALFNRFEESHQRVSLLPDFGVQKHGDHLEEAESELVVMRDGGVYPNKLGSEKSTILHEICLLLD
jgi:hypothetical protein